MHAHYIRSATAVLLSAVIIFSSSFSVYGQDIGTGDTIPVTVSEINNKVYKVTKVDTDKNALMDIKSLVFSSTKREYILKLNMSKKTITYKIGMNDFCYNSNSVLWDKGGWIKGQWLDENNLELVFSDNEESSYFFSFNGNTLTAVSNSTEIKGSSNEVYIPDKLIAHGGGGIMADNKLLSYSNSLEALNESYKKGYRLIEIDIEWTSDNQLILLHDWENNFKYYFNKTKKCSLKEFKALKMISGLTQLTVKDLEGWAKKHTDVRIITDIKSKNVDALKKISKENPYLKKQLIPQIYAFSQYEKVAGLGYTRSLLALWGMGIKDENEILEFARKSKLFAVSIAEEKNKIHPRLVPEFKKLGVFAYVHTINDVKIYNELVQTGAYGIFTDSVVKSDMDASM